VATKQDLRAWVVAALREAGGSASVVEVARSIWSRHRDELELSGDLFFTWQYDIRWAAMVLRKDGVIAPAQVGADRKWTLVPSAKLAAATTGR
jgi:hypothetical protein